MNSENPDKDERVIYHGHVCRNQWVARWMAVLDYLKIKYEFNPKPVVLNSGGAIQADFWLPELGIWFFCEELQNISPYNELNIDKEKEYRINTLARETRHAVVVGFDTPVFVTSCDCNIGNHTSYDPCVELWHRPEVEELVLCSKCGRAYFVNTNGVCGCPLCGLHDDSHMDNDKFSMCGNDMFTDTLPPPKHSLRAKVYKRWFTCEKEFTDVKTYRNRIQPIETEYNGYRFRSRMEARWAVFFDAFKIEYEYEPQGFFLSDGTKYLPDFWLNVNREMQSNEPDTCKGVWVEVKGKMTSEDLHKIKLFSKEVGPIIILGHVPSEYKWYKKEYITDKSIYNMYSFWYIDGTSSMAVFCRHDGEVWLAKSGDKHHFTDSGRMMTRALKKARGARFEHGEHGASKD